MNLNPIKQNMNEVISNGPNSSTILFSYKTPVAIVGFDLETKSYYEYKTAKRWSNTTSRHISTWFKSMDMNPLTVATKPQEYFDSLIMGVK